MNIVHRIQLRPALGRGPAPPLRGGRGGDAVEEQLERLAKIRTKPEEAVP